MSNSFYWAICASLSIGLLHGCSDSSDSQLEIESQALIEAESSAIGVLDTHLEARNSSDPDLISSANNYPNVRLITNQMQVFDTYEIYRDYEEAIFMPALSASEWDHSEWEEIKIFQSSPDKVHIAVIFTRFDGQNNKIFRAPQVYIVTNQENHWGIQVRSPMPAIDLINETENLPDSEEAALEVLKNYMDARNDRDSERLAALNHYPHMLLDNVELQILETAEDYISYEENIVMHGLDYADWDHSELDKFEVIQSSSTKVHLAYTCQHLDAVGECADSEEGLWVITKVEDRWAILGRSMF